MKVANTGAGPANSGEPGMDTARRRWFHFTAALVSIGLAGRMAHAQTRTATSPAKAGRTVLIVGDSLSAEYGLRRGSGWVALLEQRLTAERMAVRVVNASISGETTAGGLARLTALLAQHRPTHVVLELGGNDALRGLPLKDTERNLARMAQAARAAGARVLIVGIQIPPNYGRRYSDELAALFVTVAKAEGAALVPFLLEGVTDAQFQADRIHPLESAQATMLANVWPALLVQLR